VRGKAGRPVALDPRLKLADPDQRALGNLLRDIVETIDRRKFIEINSVLELTKWLRTDFRKYKAVNYYTLRHDVAKAISWVARMRRLQLVRDDLDRGVPFDEAIAIAELRPLERRQVRKTLTYLRENARRDIVPIFPGFSLVLRNR
jgi:hypothetical protein